VNHQAPECMSSLQRADVFFARRAFKHMCFKIEFPENKNAEQGGSNVQQECSECFSLGCFAVVLDYTMLLQTFEGTHPE